MGKLTLISLFFLLQKAASALIGDCSENDCSNGGSCIQRDPAAEIYECTCTPEWTGPRCTYRIPNVQPAVAGSPSLACSSSPCLNGGSCQNILGKYMCICVVQWQGSNCEQLRDGSTAPISIGCGSQEFKCANGACIVSHLRCDGGRDCLDGSDEKSCSDSLDPNGMMFTGCKPWEFSCHDGTKRCIPRESRCDQIVDCANSADEYGCGYPIPDLPPLSGQCGRLEFQCEDKRCIIVRARCDGSNDCRDGSDEKNCVSIVPNPLCSVWEFDCGDNSCIHRARHCDGYADCQNDADETNCRSLAVAGGGKLPSEEQPPPGTPIHPPGNSLNLVDILIVSCAMLMAFVAITIFVYLRRVRRMHQRYFAAVAGSPGGAVGSGVSSGTRHHRHYRQQQGTPYRLSHHSTFCHHLPPHRCPASTNLLVSYNLHQGAQVLGQNTAAAAAAAAADKDETDCADEVPPAYAEVVGTSETWVRRDGSVTPPPAYEDLPSAFRH